MGKQDTKIKYASICIVHYSKIDDFGEQSAGKNPPKRGDLLRNLIESLERNTDYPAEILVWDNGGNPDDTEYLLSKVRDGTINQLIRSKDNQHFAHAWNSLAKLATGDYLSFICNDIQVAPKWLSTCVKILEDYPDRQFVSTPFISYSKTKHTIEITKEGYRVNMRSGSNCMVLRKEDWEKLGDFPVHRIGGSIWYTKNFREGWRFVAPPEDLAGDMAHRKGVNFTIPIEVKQTLLDGSKIFFHEKQ